MKRYTIKKRNIEYIRINKAEARTYFNNGYSIFLVPCKANVNSPFISLFRISKRYDKVTDFNTQVFNYENYNCNWELGRYSKYFIRLRERVESIHN